MNKQTVNGDVGNVVSGDVTIHNYTAGVSHTAQQPISLLQKRDLHRLMDELVDAGESKRELWLVLHTKLNTKTVNEMTAADYHCAVEILQEHAQRVKDQKDCNTLVSKIMAITDPAYRLDRDRYCLKHFGTTHLKGLDKEQLQSVFGYFDDLLNVEPDENTVSPVSQGTELKPSRLTSKTNYKIFVVLSSLIALVIAVGIGLAIFLNDSPPTKEANQNGISVFTVETNDSVINNAIPALRSVFPGLDKYKSDFVNVSNYKQKTGWHTLVLTMTSDSPARVKYNLEQEKCYINISPDGSYARVLNSSCLSFLMDSSNRRGDVFKYHLK